MSMLEQERSVVVVIDLQGKLAASVEHAQEVLAATKRLLAVADVFAVPVLMSEQYPQGLGATEDSIARTFADLRTARRKIEKTSFGCCGDPDFEAALAEIAGSDESRMQVVIAGIETHVCVMQTALALLQRGAEVHVCWDAVSSRGAAHRRWALERLQSAGAVITNVESVAFEWARSKDHPGFREVNRMLREGQIGGDQPV